MIRVKKPKVLAGIISTLMFFLLSAVAKPQTTDIKTEYVSIEKLIKSQIIEAKIKGSGGHTENCIEFNLKNLSADSVHMWIEAGRRLVSIDSNIQDIFLVKNNTLTIGPHEEIVVEGNGYCCQSSYQSPRLSSDFNVGSMASDNWIKLAKVIDKNKFPPLAIQSAVWVLSDHHELSSIHSHDIASIEPLRKTIAEIKGVVLPWYTLTYEKDTSSLFSDKASKLYSEISYYLNTNSAVTITIRNKKGELVCTVANIVNPGRGNHTFELRLPVQNWPKGDYALLIHEDYNNLNTKKIFRL